jgi:large subunit ribosomal protein L15
MCGWALKAGRRPSTSRGQSTASRTSTQPPTFGGTPCTLLAVLKRALVWVGRNALDYATVNVRQLQDFIERGKIDPSQPIDMRTLWQSGAVGRVKDGVKLLGDVRTCVRWCVCVRWSVCLCLFCRCLSQHLSPCACARAASLA